MLKTYNIYNIWEFLPATNPMARFISAFHWLQSVRMTYPLSLLLMVPYHSALESAPVHDGLFKVVACNSNACFRGHGSIARLRIYVSCSCWGHSASAHAAKRRPSFRMLKVTGGHFKLADPLPPKVRQRHGARTELDRFVLAKLEERG